MNIQADHIATGQHKYNFDQWDIIMPGKGLRSMTRVPKINLFSNGNYRARLSGSKTRQANGINA